MSFLYNWGGYVGQSTTDFNKAFNRITTHYLRSFGTTWEGLMLLAKEDNPGSDGGENEEVKGTKALDNNLGVASYPLSVYDVGKLAAAYKASEAELDKYYATLGFVPKRKTDRGNDFYLSWGEIALSSLATTNEDFKNGDFSNIESGGGAGKAGDRNFFSFQPERTNWYDSLCTKLGVKHQSSGRISNLIVPNGDVRNFLNSPYEIPKVREKIDTLIQRTMSAYMKNAVAKRDNKKSIEIEGQKAIGMSDKEFAQLIADNPEGKGHFYAKYGDKTFLVINYQLGTKKLSYDIHYLATPFKDKYGKAIAEIFNKAAIDPSTVQSQTATCLGYAIFLATCLATREVVDKENVENGRRAHIAGLDESLSNKVIQVSTSKTHYFYHLTLQDRTADKLRDGKSFAKSFILKQVGDGMKASARKQSRENYDKYSNLYHIAVTRYRQAFKTESIIGEIEQYSGDKIETRYYFASGPGSGSVKLTKSGKKYAIYSTGSESKKLGRFGEFRDAVTDEDNKLHLGYTYVSQNRSGSNAISGPINTLIFMRITSSTSIKKKWEQWDKDKEQRGWVGKHQEDFKAIGEDFVKVKGK